MRGQRLAVTGSDRFLPFLCLRPLAGALMPLAGCWCTTFASASYAASAHVVEGLHCQFCQHWASVSKIWHTCVTACMAMPISHSNALVLLHCAFQIEHQSITLLHVFARLLLHA